MRPGELHFCLNEDKSPAMLGGWVMSLSLSSESGYARPSDGDTVRAMRRGQGTLPSFPSPPALSPPRLPRPCTRTFSKNSPNSPLLTVMPWLVSTTPWIPSSPLYNCCVHAPFTPAKAGSHFGHSRCILPIDNVAVAHTLKTPFLRATFSTYTWANPTKACLSPSSLYCT